MANDEHVALLKQGVAAWNAWRVENPDIRPDLIQANLSGLDLSGARLYLTDLIDANLFGAKLGGADLADANLSGADLSEANLLGANLSEAKLIKAKLAGASLMEATLVGADLTEADLTGCHVHGVSAWRLKLEGTKQQNLVITRPDEPKITVDNIEVAQFIYLMLNNQKVRAVIDTITSKAVLILGRFTDERKAVLDALREDCANVTTYRSCSTSISLGVAIRMKRSHCSLAWRDSSLPIFLMQKPCCRSCEQLYRTFPRCPCNQLSSRYRRSRVCSTFIGTGRRF